MDKTQHGGELTPTINTTINFFGEKSPRTVRRNGGLCPPFKGYAEHHPQHAYKEKLNEHKHQNPHRQSQRRDR